MRHIDIAQIEAATAMGWPAAYETSIAGWRVFAGLGCVGRVNSCWPMAFDGGDVEKGIGEVEAFYWRRGLVPQFKVIEAPAPPEQLPQEDTGLVFSPSPLWGRGRGMGELADSASFTAEPVPNHPPPQPLPTGGRGFSSQKSTSRLTGKLADLTERLKARGYAVKNHTAVMVADQPLLPPMHEVLITSRVTPEFAIMMSQTGHNALDGQERADILYRVPDPSAFGAIKVEGQIVAIGLAMFTGESAGIGAMRTLPQFRQKGYARSILRAVSAQAHNAGAKVLWLQVETDNPAALALYESEGFKSVYHYELLRGPST